MTTTQPMGRNAIITTAYRVATRRSDRYEGIGLSWGPVVLLLGIIIAVLGIGFGIRTLVPFEVLPLANFAITILVLLITGAAFSIALTLISSRTFTLLYWVFERVIKILMLIIGILGAGLTIVAVTWTLQEVDLGSEEIGEVDFAILLLISAASIFFTTLPQKLAPAYLRATSSRSGASWQLWWRWISLLSVTLIALVALVILPQTNQTLQFLTGGSVLALAIFWVTRLVQIREETNSVIRQIRLQASVVAATFASYGTDEASLTQMRKELLALIELLTDSPAKSFSGRPYAERCDPAILTTLHYIAGRFGCEIRTVQLAAYQRLFGANLGQLENGQLARALSQACLIWRDQLVHGKHSLMSPLNA